MARDIFHFIGQGTRKALHPVSDLIQGYRQERQTRKALSEAYDLEHDGKYVEAAGAYNQVANKYIKENALIYGMYSQDAFRMWIKAGDIDKALQQGRDLLRILDEAGWLDKSSSKLDDLSQMVGELYVAGYTTQADTFSNEINQHLAAHGLSLQPIHNPVTSNPGKLPTICPQCGGTLPDANGKEEVTCEYCGSVISANKQ